MSARTEILFDFERELENARARGQEGQEARAKLKAEWNRMRGRYEELLAEHAALLNRIAELERLAGMSPPAYEKGEIEAAREALEEEKRALSEREAQLQRREEALRHQASQLREEEERLQELRSREAHLQEWAQRLQQQHLHLEARAAELASWEERLQASEAEREEEAALWPGRRMAPPPNLSALSKFGKKGLGKKFINLPVWLHSQVEKAQEIFANGANEGEHHDEYRRPRQWVLWSLVIRAGLVVLYTCEEIWHLGPKLHRGWDSADLEQAGREVIFQFLSEAFGWAEGNREEKTEI